MNSAPTNDKADKRHYEWHTLPVARVLENLSSSETGLRSEEVELRRKKYGLNRLPAPPRRSPYIQFLSQFNNVLIYVLARCCSGYIARLADWVDAGVIVGVVLINAIIGFIQEGKAEKAVDAIRDILSHEALVLRDRDKISIQVEELVPGDVVFLHSGDKVPADLRLIESKDLRVEEALLTGESVPVDKSTGPVSLDAALGDRSCMAFSGTMVSFGQATGIVVATGEDTELRQGQCHACRRGNPQDETYATHR